MSAVRKTCSLYAWLPIRDWMFISSEKRDPFLYPKRAQNLIQLCQPEEDLDSVGGLDVLKEWLNKRSKLFRNRDNSKSPALPKPKGILLTGPQVWKIVPGSNSCCFMDISLIRLDPSRLFAPLVGETEQNFLTAFETVRSLAPAVLWMMSSRSSSIPLQISMQMEALLREC